ncbi:MAG: O-antigen ligase family protein [Candidatus Peregrinibacteria bacterium]
MNVEKNHKLTALVRWLTFFSPFLFPAYLLKFTVAGVPFTALEVFIYLLFGLWILSLLFSRRFYRSQPLSFYGAMAALLILGATVGAFKAPLQMNLPDGSVFLASRAVWGIWKGWVIAPLLYFFVLTQTLTSAEQVKRFLRSFVYSAALISLIAYGLTLVGQGMTYDLRLSGFYESANQLALILVPAVLLNIVWILQRRGNAQGWLEYADTATLTLLVHALFFTQSYAGILAVFGALVLYVFYVMLSHRKGLGRAVLGLLVLLSAFFLIVFTQLNTTKFKQFVDFNNRSSTTVRLQVYQVTWDLIQKHWLWGVGSGLFQGSYQLQAPVTLGRPPMEQNIPHPHNIFFAFWLNAGLLGLLALLGLHWLAHRRFTYPLIAFWGIILHGFFDTPFWKNDLAVIFWVVIAATALLQSYGTHSTQKPASKTRMRSGRRVKTNS